MTEVECNGIYRRVTACHAMPTTECQTRLTKMVLNEGADSRRARGGEKLRGAVLSVKGDVERVLLVFGVWILRVMLFAK